MVVLGLSECLSQILDFGDRNDRSQSTLAILLTLVHLFILALPTQTLLSEVTRRNCKHHKLCSPKYVLIINCITHR